AFLSCFNRLHKLYPAELARAALETALLRQRARAKFSHADAMYFTREALEQASGEAVSRYRAERFVPFGRVGDFCCGIGGGGRRAAGPRCCGDATRWRRTARSPSRRRGRRWPTCTTPTRRSCGPAW